MLMSSTEPEVLDRTEEADELRDGDDRRTRFILRAIEAYKASCAANGEEPTEEESWLVLLAALNAPIE
jgi:hypothetical protein